MQKRKDAGNSCDWKFNDSSVLTLIINFMSNETVCLSRMVHFYASGHDYYKIH